MLADTQMTTADHLDRARASFARHAWVEAHDAFLAADRDTPLELVDLERVGLAAHLTGNDDEAIELWGRAHHEAIRAGDTIEAARHAFWLGMTLAQRGDMAVLPRVELSFTRAATRWATTWRHTRRGSAFRS